MKNVYWDACIFHAVFSGEKGRAEDCLRIEKAAEKGEVIIYTSAVTFVECVWLKTVTDAAGKVNKLSSEHEKVIQQYFSRSYFRIINCDRQIAEEARALLWKHSLQYKDAIHVASAISQHVDVLHSYDRDLLKWDDKVGKPGLQNLQARRRRLVRA